MNILYVVNTVPDQSNPSAQPFAKAQIKSIADKGVQIRTLYIRGNESKHNYINALKQVRAIMKRGQYYIVYGH